ncbi:MAG: R3H domain-containing nucleic acid-binding protein [bacterium]|nr:R3H domain-containing nucleic acid-binding protein [bacterium]
MKKKLKVTKQKLSELLDIMQIKHRIEQSDLSGNTVLSVKTEDGALLIGRGGENLRALEYLVNVLSQKETSGELDFVMIDVEGYKKEKITTLIETANCAAQEAIENNKAVYLKPMRAYERRIIHMTLSDKNDIITESQGVEPYRVVVIKKRAPNSG